MPYRCRPLAVLAVLIAALPAAAQNITVETDQAVYQVGDLVQITITNHGPADADFMSAPYAAIVHLETGDCVLGCVGLPVMTPFPTGAVEVMGHDTGFLPDRPGIYSVTALVAGIPPAGGRTSTEYTLEESTANTGSTWGQLKTLYR